MKKKFYYFSFLTSLMATCVLSCSGSSPEPQPQPEPEPEPVDYYAQFLMPAAQEDGITRAFPGAEGGGYVTTGGRGGTILHVTRLEDDSAEGSLRWAVNQSGARTIVFDTGGIIELKSRLEIKNGDLTIAGQTAPGDGICIKGQNVRIKTDNVIIRFLRFRMGDESMTEDDPLNCYTGDIPGYSNIIIDHCSLSWSTDECGTFYGVSDFTLQYCIISESLKESIHGKGSHGYGGIWGGQNASFHHNLLAHHNSRNPRFDHDFVSALKGPVHFYNNIIYNWGSNSAYGGESSPGQSPKQINIVSNYYKAGPATSKHNSRIVNPTTSCDKCSPSSAANAVPAKMYVDGNHVDGYPAVTADNWTGVEPDDAAKKTSIKSDAYLGTKPSTIQDATAAYTSVLQKAGASLVRDAVDIRVVTETKTGTYTYNGSNGSTGGLIDSQSDVGGWPSYSKGTAATDTDKDGMPDSFEDSFGLNKSDPSDAIKKTLDKYGRYSNFEMYLHYLVRQVI